MDIKQILDNIDAENLYSHVLSTEGVKHPVFGPEALEACADYILEQFDKFGLETNEQQFTIEAFDYDLRNIEAWLGDGSGPELLVVSHYDTVWNAPGANDNGTAIAVMLEAARVLAETDVKGVRFISFTLEEGNPYQEHKWNELLKSMEFIDGKKRYTSFRAKSIMKEFNKSRTSAWNEGKEAVERFESGLAVIKDELDRHELKMMEKYLSEIIPPAKGEGYGLIGSRHWVKKALEEGREVTGVLCLETVGYTSKEEYSQRLPDAIDRSSLKHYNTDDSLTTGDFVAVVADKNSGSLAQSYCTSCEREEIELPYGLIHVPLGYDDLRRAAPDLLRSDHAPFWMNDIPALMLTDTANFRYPYYHTEADTIDKLDFEFLEKVCRATVATVLKAKNE